VFFWPETLANISYYLLIITTIGAGIRVIIVLQDLNWRLNLSKWWTLCWL